ncbi:DUF4369 domain-containing protein [Spirosoma pollinicola]|uniref:DUF4369 domain-containing protein n=1 Tax=Spirosoma pollinicola TaxID=2057025 RepID=A0A2K8YWX8_9BACT|nr:DUF4369 domain-containing protein [Spirosoma pollinicola]AUD02131.1 hypothetical protein CWM47_10045 [Spirosoma pollinicola]
MNLIKRLLQINMAIVSMYCHGQGTNGYQVIGEVTGLPVGTKMYLIDGGKRKTIDSATVKNDQFTFKGILAEPAHMYLHAGRGRMANKLADILLDNRTVYVKGSKPEYDSVKVSGSDIDQYWKDWYKEDQKIGYQRYRIKQVYASLTAKKDTANANVLGKLIEELQLARIDLLKTYVKRQPNTAAGAALPTLCTLGDYLTGADYMEMFNTLTPTWQQSSFGKEILVQARKKRDRSLPTK